MPIDDDADPTVAGASPGDDPDGIDDLREPGPDGGLDLDDRDTDDLDVPDADDGVDLDELDRDESDDTDDPDGDEALTADASMIEHARRRFGTLGAVVAGGMLGLEKVLGQKVKEEAPVEWEAPGEPLDIDRRGITVPLDEDSVVHSKPSAVAADGRVDRTVTRRRRP